ncbi:MAG: VapC toxin family PIN domain ribonuclease [Gammaproteobacteria bacterium HGW-Gammaproteobacteria-8]|nr:MAG: VapC toxin family PIN domain ribonuclease [Gammaproteobacteria bacterium HGW-Gammaproteobacteria-8]
MIFLDTNVISETMKPVPDRLVVEWLIAHDAELAVPAITIAELAFGIERIRPEQRAVRLARGLDAWRERLAGRILAFNERAAMCYGELMGRAARAGTPMAAPDGMIAATVLANGGALATRNIDDFRGTGLNLINPWASSRVRDR